MLLRNHAMLITAAVLLAGVSLSRTASAQDKEPPQSQPEAKPVKLEVGDSAPPLKVEKFLKGEPVTAYKPGHIYVVEFWATWCGPCKASMPHVTELQKKFAQKVTFIGVNIWEDREYSDQTLPKVQEFVKKNGENMGYTVAYDGAAKKTDKAFMQAADQNGIPCAFIITPDAKIAYIGHPMDKRFEETLQQLVDGTFDMKKAVVAFKEEQSREADQEKLYRRYQAVMNEAQSLIKADKIDEGLAKVEEAEKLRPDSNATDLGMRKFLLLMNEKKYDRAYAIGAELVAGPIKDNAMALNAVSWSIIDPEAAIEKPDLDLALKAAELAAKASESKDASIIDTLARCYWLKGNKAKAIELQTQAVKLCEEDSPMKDSLQKTLEEYKK